MSSVLKVLCIGNFVVVSVKSYTVKWIVDAACVLTGLCHRLALDCVVAALSLTTCVAALIAGITALVATLVSGISALVATLVSTLVAAC